MDNIWIITTIVLAFVFQAKLWMELGRIFYKEREEKFDRDYLAAKAMQSMIANPMSGHWNCASGADKKEITKWAYMYADEMLKQREQCKDNQ